jgi:hypothetical protein
MSAAKPNPGLPPGAPGAPVPPVSPGVPRPPVAPGSRAIEVALWARRFRLLAERVELLREDAEERFAAATDRRSSGALNRIDTAQIAAADELDRMCGYAVRVLSAPGSRGSRALLDVLGVLDPDRICGMYYALPPDRRDVVLRDYVWAYHVERIKREMPAALAIVDELCIDADVAEQRRSQQPDALAERSRHVFRYILGLEHDLSDDEVAQVEQRRGMAHALAAEAGRRADG